MQIQLNGKSALVCGSSQGIGLASAIELSELGAKITLCARNEADLNKALQQLSGDGHSTLVANFDDPDDLVQKVQSHIDSNGAFNILINNSGGPPGGPLFKADTEEFFVSMRRHLSCNHRLVQTLVPGMIELDYGRIVNIISTSVREPIQGLGVSNTTRGAVASWAKTLSKELGPNGITINSVLPGFTDTSRLSQLMEKKASNEGKTPNEVKDTWLGSIPLGRLASASEIGSAVAFLCSPAAAYITGVCLPVDGGRLNLI
ncbi:MAG: SDR family oxidoreductase [Planctomycetia bacterium]|nr:SDR family oxidoreductase [Planctomycetia bacterium]NCG12198.1 SDR family oxidoreductase [Planctomycetia bacterium]NCG56929.1 SDR family oxidoreductase [Pseudomonadota bacterium]